jgi:hypothetical protein
VTGAYGPVTLLPATAPTGFYLVTVYVVVSAGTAGDSVTINFSYQDDV